MMAFEAPALNGSALAVKTPWFSIARAMLGRQVYAELFGMPGYRFTLKTPPVFGFVAAPHDARPANTLSGKAMLAGRFALADGRMSTQGSGDPWNRPCPTRSFAIELHRFAWLPHLMTQGGDGAREALRLCLMWRETFLNWTPFAWSHEVVARRLINLSVHARRLCVPATPDQVDALTELVATQTRHLMRLPVGPAHASDKAIALCVAGAVLEGRVGERYLDKGIRRLSSALKRVVLTDGSHASRSPQAALDLLYDLHMLEDALSQRAVAIPDYIAGYREKLGRFVRTLSHPDGSLCGFQGSQSLSFDEVSPVFLHETQTGYDGLPFEFEHGRYQRLEGRSLSVFVDVGEARAGPLGLNACDHALSFEVSGGRDKLIVEPGWCPTQGERQSLRIIGAGNTLTLGEQSILTPTSGKFAELMEFALTGLRYRVRHRRVATERTGALLEMEHEGWRPRFGMKHERRLFVDPTRDELRGEDRMIQVEARKDMPAGVPFAIRFTLHPEVQATLARDNKSILLRAPGGRGWWIRHDAKEVDLEVGTVIEHDKPRKTTVVALKGVCVFETPPRVRWKLSPAEG
jgi:uncharacterized heparinase superfamily protein